MPSLIASLGLNVSGFKAGLAGAQSDAARAGKQIASSMGEAVANKLGLFGGAAAVTGLIESTMETTERIRQLSQQFRVSTDTIQIWDRAAEKVGMTADDIGNAMNRLKKAREGAIKKDDVGGFGQFGIGMAELKDSAITTEELMNRMRASAAGHPITDEEDVAGMELMGRSGAKVLSAMEEIGKLGPMRLVAAEDIESLHEADERIKEIKRNMTAGVAEIAGGALSLTDKFSNLFTATDQFLKGNLKWGDMWAMINGEGVAAGGGVEAPKLDLKGRALLSSRAKPPGPEPDAGTTYHITKTVNLNKDLAEVEKLREHLAEKIAQNNLKAMTVDERRVALKKEIAEHEKKAIEYEFGEGEDKLALEEKIKAEQLRGELTGLDKKGGMHPSEANALQRIGGMATAPELAGLETARRSENHLQAIRLGIETMAKNKNDGVTFG